jgi:phage tail tape-measure protein
MGSTPLMEQMQQNSANIASGDMNNWLQHVLGINTQYGQGQQNLMNMGANSANALTNMYGDMGRQMGEAAYGKAAGNQQDMWNKIGGAAQLAMMFL